MKGLIELAQNIKHLALIFQMRLQGQSICSCRVYGSMVLWTISYFSLSFYFYFGVKKEHSVKTWRGNTILLNARLHVCLCAFHADTQVAFCFLLKTDKRIYGRRYRSLLHITTSSALAKLNLLTLQGFTFDGV